MPREEGKNAVKWTRLSCYDFVDNHRGEGRSQFPADNLPDRGVAVPRELFRAILEGIERLRLATATSG
jgi:hypothetical protein